MTRTPASTPATGLPQLWALILLTALVIGLIFGLLTYAHTKGTWTAALLAALSAAGATVIGMQQVLGGA